ncbi:MAG: AAA family ATPase, partial [Methanomassiliicoccaceae archaeon]|nr:AAA family ATPase [Methanomassiliicoccaceae archaeon]
MFKKIVLDNFKSFNHITFDLTGAEKAPVSYALIYGKNGSGKSNLIESLMFLKDTLRTYSGMSRTSGVMNEDEILSRLNWNITSDHRAMNMSERSMVNAAG